MAVVHKSLTGDEAIHPSHYYTSSDPGAVGANKDWIDTTSGTSLIDGFLWKIRNAGDTAWTTLLDLATALALKANLAGPTFTGDAKAVTASYGDNDTSIATTAFVQSAVTTRTDDGNSSTALTVDWSTHNVSKVTLTGNCTFTFTAPGTGAGVLVLELAQDATGSRTATWPAAVHWSGGTAPTLTTTASKVDVFTFYYNGTTYFGVTSGLNYTA